VAFDDNNWSSTRTEYEIEGLNKQLFKKQIIQFGPYTTNGVKRSWTRGTTAYSGWMNTLWTKHERKKQTLRFVLNDSMKNATEIFCINQVNSNDLIIGKNENSLPNIILDLTGNGGNYSNIYLVEIYVKGDAVPWTLAWDGPASAVSDKGFVGHLQHGNKETYQIIPISKMTGPKGTVDALFHAAVAYEFRNENNNAVAAFSSMKNKIYLANVSAQLKLVMLSAVTALMLREII